MTFSETLLVTRVAVELFPRCLKCGGDLSTEPLSNIVPVVGRDRRHVHHTCPRAEAA
jgi:hypothetical protein